MGRRLTKWSGRDRCHSGGFLLRIMPPSWQPVPACTRNGHSAGGQFINAATNAAGGPFNTATTGFSRRAILRCRNDCCRRNCNTLRQRKLESDAAPLRQRLRRRAVILAGTMVLHRFLISSSNLRIDAAKRSKQGQSMHRFLISGPDLRIDAAKKLNLGQSVHRFPISSPDLRIDAANRSKEGQSVHRFLISCPELRIDAAQRSKPE